MAVSLAAQLRDKLGLEVRLTAGSGGEFEIVVNGELIYSKRATGQFPDEAPLLETIRQLDVTKHRS